MKTLTKIALVVAAVAISANAYAGFPKINTGNSTMNNVVNKSVSAAKNKAIADDINKNIQKIACDFKNIDTDHEFKQGGCLDRIISTINKKKSNLEAFGLAKVYVNIKAHGSSKNAYKRSSHVRDVMYGQMNYWRYNVRSVKDDTNNLEVWVEVKD